MQGNLRLGPVLLNIPVYVKAAWDIQAMEVFNNIYLNSSFNF
jgi:hypothetical protein